MKQVQFADQSAADTGLRDNPLLPKVSLLARKSVVRCQRWRIISLALEQRITCGSDA
jgi:hypothetical protein